jgi:sugar phosphate isomerase/epimerase
VRDASNLGNTLSRRNFLRNSALLPLGVAAGGTGIAGGIASAQAPIQRCGGPKLKISLNAYSFAKPLNDHLRGRGKGITLFDLLDFCAQHDFEAIDPTGYYFPGYGSVREGKKGVPTDAYIRDFKRRAFELGIAISGTGVANDLATADAEKRAADVKHIQDWVEVAAKLGAPVLRVFSGPVPRGYEDKWDEVAQWMVADLKKCTQHAEKYGVLIGIQNHGDMLKSADQVLKIIQMVDSPWFGAINDTGYYLTPDPYVDMARVVPYTVNWQVKQRLDGKEGTAPMDLKRLIGLMKVGGYRGYVPIETLSQPGQDYDPFTVVPQFLRQVRQAIAATA